MQVYVLPREITYLLPHRETRKLTRMFNIHKEIRIFEASSPIEPLVNVAIR